MLQANVYVGVRCIASRKVFPAKTIKRRGRIIKTNVNVRAEEEQEIRDARSITAPLANLRRLYFFWFFEVQKVLHSKNDNVSYNNNLPTPTLRYLYRCSEG